MNEELEQNVLVGLLGTLKFFAEDSATCSIEEIHWGLDDTLGQIEIDVESHWEKGYLGRDFLTLEEYESYIAFCLVLYDSYDDPDFLVNTEKYILTQGFLKSVELAKLALAIFRKREKIAQLESIYFKEKPPKSL